VISKYKKIVIMAFSGVKLDPDDMFDKVVFMENKLIQEGYNTGFSNGEEQGKLEGFALGIKHGREIGKELGFYKGFVKTWLLFISTDKKRAVKLLEQLHQLLNEYNDSVNIEDETMQDKVDIIRAKFKQVSSVLKVPTELIKDEASQFSF